MRHLFRTLSGLAAGLLLAVGAWANDEGPSHVHGQGSVRIPMEELHKHGGVPPGWKFAFPAGDPNAGRELFVKLECFKCHEIKGEPFPQSSREPTDKGPELTAMGEHHPAEYFAESILNPNAVIITGPGYTGSDQLSIMPDYRDSLTVAEFIDLVAYVKSLKAPAMPTERGHGHGAPDKPGTHAH